MSDVLVNWINQLRGKSGLIFIGLLILLGVFMLTTSSTEPSISYLQDVQPILASKCYACHGPDEEKREAGLRLDKMESLHEMLESGNSVINQKKLRNSEIIKRITSSDQEYIMPPIDSPKPLKDEEIQILKDWVLQGAKWQNHWSYEPLKVQIPPNVRDKKWSLNPIDAFILSAQMENGLRPSQEADKRTLLRRLTYDLHGLPPSIDEMEDFLNDHSDDSYLKEVDRLLASPRYGERWARHWLDVVHYGETHGYDKDQRRVNSWPYRDYVINALNDDIPYGRFIEDQIAGDVLYPNDPQSTVALGFLAAGPWDLVGHVELKDGTKDKRIVRNLDRDDMVTTTMASFTGLTVQCARCHDHKFDPIRQSDYYSLQAVFAGIDRADRSYDKDPNIFIIRRKLNSARDSLTSELDRLAEKMGENEVHMLSELDRQKTTIDKRISELIMLPTSNYGYHSKIENHPEFSKWIVVDLGKNYKLDQINLVPAYRGIALNMPGYGFPVRFKVEVSRYKNFKHSVTPIDLSTQDHHERTDKPFRIDLSDISGRYIKLTANKLWKGRGEEYFLSLAEVQVFSGQKNVARNRMVKVSDTHGGQGWQPGYLTDGFDSYRIISGEDLPAESKKKLVSVEAELTHLETQENETRRSVLNRNEREELDKIRKYLLDINDSLKVLPEPDFVYAATTKFKGQFRFGPNDSIRIINRLNRGDTEQPLEEVHPGTVATFVDLPDRFKLPEGHDESARRAALARWMTDQNNAFTWRSIANRIWQYHFGKGIVSTPNDFGKMGTPPSHPELLDYLSLEFLNNGQSLKWLHRLIVTSATYKQGSIHNQKNQYIDASNTYLWKANRRQLEAEAVWDGVLAVSGKLDLTMGGPGFDAFRYEDDHSPRYLYKDYNAYDPSSFRRSVYRSIVRSVPDPFMTTLDCADPSQSVPVRNETVTALQALSALNNPFIVRQAGFLAERLKSEKDELEDQLAKAYELSLLRLPENDELEELKNYATHHGLAATCRLIFAMNEFLYVD